MIIDLKEYIPNKIIPRIGKLKSLKVSENNNKLILRAKDCRKVITLNRFTNLSNEDFIAIGIYFAEGQRRINLNKQIHHSGEIAISNGDLKCLQIFCNLMEKLGIKRTEFKVYAGLNINLKEKISQREVLDYWLSSLNLTKACLRPNYNFTFTGTKNKKVPTCTGFYGCLNMAYASVIFRSFFLYFINKIFIDCINAKNKQYISLILKGFFAGDGHVEYSYKPRRKGLYFCNKDDKFISLLVKSLELLGINSYFITDPNKTKTNSKSLVVAKYSYMKILIDYKITDLINYKKEKARELINSYKIINGKFS